MMDEVKSKTRVAVYTRKSLEEGLDQEINSLEVQRQAVEDYVASKRSEGLVLLKKHYDDGGYSGANPRRPALEDLLDDIDKGLVDMVAVYKIDRLSRSLMDFADIFRHFESRNVKFLSVTQQIDTSTPAGRMSLNILMTFAQFEREMISDRIRDKVHACIKKGIWMGGTVPLGYIVENRKLVVQPDEAGLVRDIFGMFLRLGDTGAVASELRSAGEVGRKGGRWTGARVWAVIRNPIYKGYLLLKGKAYRGEHRPIVAEETWEQANELYRSRNAGKSKRGRGVKSLAPLAGILKCGHCGGAMTPAYTVRRGVRYNYYVCTGTSKGRRKCPNARVAAPQVEAAVIAQIVELLKVPTLIRRIADHLGQPPAAVRGSLSNIAELWDALFPVEKQRLIGLLVDSATLGGETMDIRIKVPGACALVREMEAGDAN